MFLITRGCDKCGSNEFYVEKSTGTSLNVVVCRNCDTIIGTVTLIREAMRREEDIKDATVSS